MLKRLPLPWRWFLGLAALLAALLLVASLSINLTLPAFLTAVIRQDLERNAKLASQLFIPKLPASALPHGEINALAGKLSGQTGLRVTIMSADGVVIGESGKPPNELLQIENHLQRPEVQDAIKHGVGSATRRSDTVDVDLLYVAVTCRGPGDRLIGFVRVALPLDEVKQVVSHVNRTVALASVIVGVLAIPLLFWTARKTTRPLLKMRDVAARVAQGDFSKRAPTGIQGELGELSVALNDMSAQLEARLREITQEKAELSAILGGMSEGVLVLGGNDKIRILNNALRHWFQIGDEVIGHTVLEVFRSVPLQEVVTEAATCDEVQPRELTFVKPDDRTFAVVASCLRGDTGECTGVVVVFHDITRIKQLENVRKEFVANVSHELRTPLSIIKGYVETLLDEHPPEPDAARQFLQTIQRHARRLEALISDLLSLSALESQQARLNFESLSPREVALAVANELDHQAKAKSIAIHVGIQAEFPAVRADSHRLHQVFFNLLDNAVKYTQTGGRITVTAGDAEKDNVTVCVADNGPGIAAEHLPHVFERFYRVDKARSRELGGTGLGLAIVKHVILSHGGRVWAESELEKGSRFYFTLPKA
jgi:two-component system phosphate regulon sensor histidine kinase PhoR